MVAPRAGRPADRIPVDAAVAERGPVGAQVTASPPTSAEIADVAGVFDLLGEPGRLRLLLALAESEEMCVRDLAGAVGLGESAASHALRLLRAHRVVAARRSGRLVLYRLDDGHVRSLLALALEHTRHAEATQVPVGQAPV